MLIKNKINIRKVALISISVLLTMLLLSCSSARVISEQSFNSIAKYEYGQDRSSLTNFSNLVDSLATLKENKKIAEDDILNFLQSDATFASKQFACRKLRIIGTERSVDVLSEMLLDKSTISIAKYALENIQGAEVNDKLIDMLIDSPKDVKICLIDMLANRKSLNATVPIGELLKSNDSDIKLNAAYALGQIGTEQCINYLGRYFEVSQPLLGKVLDSYLLCVDNLCKQNKSDLAKIKYSYLLELNIPFQYKHAALVGIINSSEDKLSEIENRITNSPNEIKFIPISKIKNLDKTSNLINIAKLLPSLEPANQIQLLGALECSGNSNIKPYVLQLLSSDVKAVKIASIKALAKIGNEEDVIRLANIVSDRKSADANAALSALELLKGDLVDDTIVANLLEASPKLKVALIKAIGIRKIKSAFDELTEYTKSDNRKIRTATFRSLSEISDESNLKELLDILKIQKDFSDRRKVENSISKVIEDFPSNNNFNLINTALNSCKEKDNQCSFIRLLGSTNSNDALTVLRSKLNNTDEEIRISAINGLSYWKTSEPLVDLEKAMTNATSENEKSPALMGFVKYLKMNNKLKPSQKVILYKKALSYAKTSNERNLTLEALGRCDDFESLEIFNDYINQEDVKETVNKGIDRVAWHLYRKNPEKVKSIVLDFTSKINDSDFHAEIDQLLLEINDYMKNK